MNRICFVLNKNGELDSIAADSDIEIYIVAPHCPRDRVYLYQSADIGPEHVRKLIGGYSVGHAEDGMLGEGTGSRLPPSKPKFSVVGK